QEVGGEVLVLLREPFDRALRARRVAARRLLRRFDGRVGASGSRGPPQAALAVRGGDDLHPGLDRRRRGDRRPAELEDDRLAQRTALAIAITSARIADAVAWPPAPGPLQTSRSAISDSSVMTL